MRSLCMERPMWPPKLSFSYLFASTNLTRQPRIPDAAICLDYEWACNEARGDSGPIVSFHIMTQQVDCPKKNIQNELNYIIFLIMKEVQSYKLHKLGRERDKALNLTVKLKTWHCHRQKSTENEWKNRWAVWWIRSSVPRMTKGSFSLLRLQGEKYMMNLAFL